MELSDQMDNPSDRRVVMDSHGIHPAVTLAALPGIETEFEDDFEGLYANLTALNRYLGREWGFNLRRSVAVLTRSDWNLNVDQE